MKKEPIDNTLKGIDKSQNKHRIKVLLTCLFLSIILDGLITKFFVNYGLAVEGNPFLSYWVRTDIFLLFKIAFGLLIIISLWIIYPWFPKLVTICTILLLALYTAVVIWNIAVLL